MKLYASKTSPYVRKIEILLQEKGLAYEAVEGGVWATHSQVPALNPLGKIPTLVLEDGTVLYDSRVISAYLEAYFPSPQYPIFMPEDLKDRIEILKWEALADGVCEAVALAFLETKRGENERSLSWVERQKAKIDRGISEIARLLGEKSWCDGRRFSLADIAVGSALFYLGLRFPQIKWQEEYPNLASLTQRLMERSSFQKTKPLDSN